MSSTKGIITQHCYVLGAGFSRACGLPLASELSAAVWKHISRDPVSAGLRVWHRWLEQLYPCCNLVSKWPDFEDLITLLDERAKYQGEYEGGERSNEPRTARHFKRVLLRHMALMLLENCRAIDAKGKESLSRFVTRLVPGYDTIISFNWDLLIEIACSEKCIPVRYERPVVGGIHVIKPHGSINLAEIDRSFYDDLVRHDHLTIEDNGKERVVVRATDPLCSATSVIAPFADQDKLLVEPAARKVYQWPWIQRQWRLAWDALHKAQEVFILGFSLPQNDYRPRVLFQLLSLSRRKPPRITLVDPKARCVIRRRYTPFVKSHIEPVAKHWEDWLGEMS